MQLAKVGKEDVKLPPDVVWKWGVNAVYSQGSYVYLRIPTFRKFHTCDIPSRVSSKL